LGLGFASVSIVREEGIIICKKALGLEMMFGKEHCGIRAIRKLQSRLSVAGAKEAAEKGQFIDRNG